MNQAQNFEVIAISMTIAIIGFSAAVLFVRETPRRDQRVMLAGFLGLYGLVKGDELFYASGGYLVAPHFTGVFYLAKILLGPAIYFYARSMTSREPHWLTRKDAWALLWPIILFACASWFFFLSGEQKLGLITRQFPDPALRDRAYRLCTLTFLLNFVVSVGYLAFAFRLFLKHARHVRAVFSNIEDKSLDWLRWVLLILAGGWTWYTVGEIWGIHGGRPGWYDPLTAFLELGWITAIAFFGVLQRPVFDARTAAAESAPSENEKYARCALSGERMARIATRLQAAMTQDKLYRDPDLSLRALSDHIGFSENNISQTFSEKLGQNFFDFVNSYRVAEARLQLEQTNDSILAIAHDVGFNSRSTFNAAFKKHAGATPSAHRASLSGRRPLTAPSTP